MSESREKVTHKTRKVLVGKSQKSKKFDIIETKMSNQSILSVEIGRCRVNKLNHNG